MAQDIGVEENPNVKHKVDQQNDNQEAYEAQLPDTCSQADVYSRGPSNWLPKTSSLCRQ